MPQATSHLAEPIEAEFEHVESKHLVANYRLVPVSEHPLFPGSSQALSLTQDQYELMKDNTARLFASVVKNDEVLKKEIDIVG